MSRMEKYTSNGMKSRTNKNEKLYKEVGDLSINYDYIDVNNAVELNPDDDYKSSRENYHKKKELDSILKRGTKKPVEVVQDVLPKEERVYDINEILKNSKVEDEEEKYNERKRKRLINTEYNILTKLDIKDLDKENYRKEDLKSLINDIYAKEEPKKMTNIESKNDDELFKELLDDEDNSTDLIDDLNLKEELAKDILEKNQDDLGTVPITEEINKEAISNKEIPESYHDNEDDNEMFIFDDIEKKKNRKKKKNREISEITQTLQEEAEREDGIDYDNIEKEGKGLFIAIIIVVILIILTVLFFLYEYFFGI